MKIIKTISRNICKIGKSIQINLLVMLPDDKEFFTVRKDTSNRNINHLYVDIDIWAMLAIYIKYQFTLIDRSVIDSNKTGTEKIYLNQVMQSDFLSVIENFIDFVENTEGIFKYNTDTKQVEVNYDMFKNNNFEYIYKDYLIKLRPRVINNDRSEQYVNILFEYIGESKAEFTKVALIRYKDLKRIRNILRDVDLFMYSQLLLNFVGKKTKVMDPQDLTNTESISNIFEVAEQKMVDRLERGEYNEKEQEAGN